jgi:hypothetical protein
MNPGINSSIRNSNVGINDATSLPGELNISREKSRELLFSGLVSYLSKYEQSAAALTPLMSKDIPAPNLDPDTAAVFMMALMSSVSETDYKGKMQLIVSNMKTSDKLNEAMFKKMSENMKKAAEIAKQNKSSQISNDVALGMSTTAAVFGFVGALLLTAFSLGGGAAVLIGAGIGLVQTLMSVADRVAEAADAKWEKQDGTTARVKISWEGMMERILDDPKLIPAGMNKEDTEKYKQYMSMAISIAISLALMAGSLACGYAGIVKSGDKLSDALKNAASLGAKMNVLVANRASQVSSTVSGGADLIGSASTIVSSGYGVSIAFMNFDMKEADNQKNYIQALNESINKFIDSQRDGIAQNIENIGASYEAMSSVVADIREVGSRSVSSIGRV